MESILRVRVRVKVSRFVVIVMVMVRVRVRVRVGLAYVSKLAIPDPGTMRLSKPCAWLSVKASLGYRSQTWIRAGIS